MPAQDAPSHNIRSPRPLLVAWVQAKAFRHPFRLVRERRDEAWNRTILCLCGFRLHREWRDKPVELPVRYPSQGLGRYRCPLACLLIDLGNQSIRRGTSSVGNQPLIAGAGLFPDRIPGLLKDLGVIGVVLYSLSHGYMLPLCLRS